MPDLYAQLSAAPVTTTVPLGALSTKATVSVSIADEVVHISGALARGESLSIQAPFPQQFREAPALDPARLGPLVTAAAEQSAPDARALLDEAPEEPGIWSELLGNLLYEVAARLPQLFTPPVSPGSVVDWLCTPEHPWLSGTLASSLDPAGRIEAHGVQVRVIPEGVRVTARVISWDANDQIENIVEQEVWAGLLPLARWSDPAPDVAAAAGPVAAWLLLLCGLLAAHDEDWLIFPHDLFEMWPWALLEGSWETFTPRATRRSPVKRLDDRTVQIGAWRLGLRDDVLLLHKKQDAGVPILWQDGDRIHVLDGDEGSASALLAWLSEHTRPHSPELSDTFASWQWRLSPLPSWRAGAEFLAARGLLARLGAWRRYGQFLRTRQPGFRSWLEHTLR